MNQQAKIKPYVGVTDVASREQVDLLKAALPDRAAHLLHVGVMTSYKVLHGIPTSKGWENIWPRPSEMKKIFCRDPQVINVLHYADYHGSTRSDDLILAVEKCDRSCDALQLDMTWPNPDMLQEVLQKFTDLKLVLQVNSTGLSQIKNDLEVLADLIGRYSRAGVSYFLLDLSMGRGVPLDAERSKELATCCLASGVREEQIVFAGGLGPHSLDRVAPLIRKYPRSSVDAQGKLRPSGSAADPLDIGYAVQYVKEVSRMYLESSRPVQGP